MHANDSTLVLKHYLLAHTDSDISVNFTEADIFHFGDTFWNRNYRYIDYSTGGSIDGAATVDEITAENYLVRGSMRVLDAWK